MDKPQTTQLSEGATKFIQMIAENFGDELICIETDIDMPKELDDKMYALLYNKKESKTIIIEMVDTAEEVKELITLTDEQSVDRVNALHDLESVLKLMNLPQETFTEKVTHKNDKGEEVSTYQRFITNQGHFITMAQPGFHYCVKYKTFVMVFTEDGKSQLLMFPARELFGSSTDGSKIFNRIEVYSE